MAGRFASHQRQLSVDNAVHKSARRRASRGCPQGESGATSSDQLASRRLARDVSRASAPSPLKQQRHQFALGVVSLVAAVDNLVGSPSGSASLCGAGFASPVPAGLGALLVALVARWSRVAVRGRRRGQAARARGEAFVRGDVPAAPTAYTLWPSRQFSGSRPWQIHRSTDQIRPATRASVAPDASFGVFHVEHSEDSLSIGRLESGQAQRAPARRRASEARQCRPADDESVLS